MKLVIGDVLPVGSVEEEGFCEPIASVGPEYKPQSQRTKVTRAEKMCDSGAELNRD